MKDGISGTPSIEDWLIEILPQGQLIICKPIDDRVQDPLSVVTVGARDTMDFSNTSLNLNPAI